MNRFLGRCICAFAVSVLAGFGAGLAAHHLPPVLGRALHAPRPAVNFKPVFDPHNFVDKIDNQYFPLKPGTVMIYSGIKAGKHAVQHFEVTTKREVIMGVNTVIVHDQTHEDGQLAEYTIDWYAQDKEGNVWYFGEATKKLDKGKWSTEGSWKAGTAGTHPGIYAQAHPRVGDTYEQEYYENGPGDSACVVALSELISAPYGSYKNALLTMEWTPHDPGIDAKYYVPGVGVVKEMAATGATEALMLDKIITK